MRSLQFCVQIKLILQQHLLRAFYFTILCGGQAFFPLAMLNIPEILIIRIDHVYNVKEKLL